jgi:hypothetical protein
VVLFISGYSFSLSTKIGSGQVRLPAQKNFKKIEKKACHRAGSSVRRDAGDKKPVQAVQKKLKKKLARP